MLGSNSRPYQFHPIFLLLLLLLLLILRCHGTQAQSPIQPIQAIPSHRRAPGWDHSMAIFIGSLFGAFILVVAISAFLRRCAESCLTQQQQGNNTEWPCSCSHSGIDPETVETFPTLLYSAVKDLRIRKDGVPDAPLECAVCLGEFTADDTLRLLPHCNHVFHLPCIDAWLSSHVTCPVCRANLNRDPGEVAISVTTTQISGGENDGEVYRNRAERSGAGGSEIEGRPTAREASEVSGNGEEDKGVPERSSKSKLSGKRMVYARSNSTGHSVVEAGECVERYTLRLPEDMMKYILLNHVMAVQRSASFNVAGSGKKGMCWSDSEGGSSRGKRNSFGVRGGRNVK